MPCLAFPRNPDAHERVSPATLREKVQCCPCWLLFVGPSIARALDVEERVYSLPLQISLPKHQCRSCSRLMCFMFSLVMVPQVTA